MADRWAVATGNWSATGTWNGSTLPTTGDDVYADGFTVTIDQDVNVGSLRTTTRSGGTAGGGFVISANGGIDVACTHATTGLWPSNTLSSMPVLTHTATSGVNTYTGKAIANQGVTTYSACIVVSGIGGRLDVIGAVRSGYYANGITITVNATVNVTGNVSAHSDGGGGVGKGIALTTTCTLTVNGDVIGGPITVGDCGIYADSGIPTVTINGNVLGGNAPGIVWNVNSSLTINGSVTGGISGGGYGITSNAASTITITGAATAGATAAIGLTGSSMLIVADAATASAGAAAIESSGASSMVRVRGNIVDDPNTGQAALYCIRVESRWTVPAYRRMKKYTGGTVDLVTTDSVAGVPAAANVRSGTTYGATSEFTGTLAMPAAAYVSLGVPVDATVGSATASSAAEIWAYLTSSASTSGSMGERLRNASTPATTGAQLAAQGS